MLPPVKPRDVWLAAFASALGVSPTACRDAPPASPAVTSREVAAWDAGANAAAPASSDAASLDAAAPDAPAPVSAAPTQDAGPSLARLEWFDVVTVARPKTQGAGPGAPPDPCARGRNTPECRRAGLVDPPDMRAAMRGGLQFETHAGLAPKPALDAASAASAARAITGVERQAFLCAFSYVGDSMLVAIELATTGGSDGLHARITGAEAAPEFARCMRPSLENGAWFASEGITRCLRFNLALRAVWH